MPFVIWHFRTAMLWWDEYRWCVPLPFRGLWLCSLEKMLKIRPKRKHLLQFQTYLFVFSIPLYSCALLYTCQWFAILSDDGNRLTPWSKIYISQCVALVAHVYRLYENSSVIYSQPVIVCSLLSNRSTYSSIIQSCTFWVAVSYFQPVICIQIWFFYHMWQS